MQSAKIKKKKNLILFHDHFLPHILHQIIDDTYSELLIGSLSIMQIKGSVTYTAV
jgi:hypothetical protein